MLAAWLALAIMAGAAVWWSSTRLARRAGLLSDRLGGQEILVGSLVLGIITALPELTTTITAAAWGSPALATNNLLGGIAAQMTILVVADAALGGRLTARVHRLPVLAQSIGLLVLLTLAWLGMQWPGPTALGMGAWTASLAAVYVLLQAILRRIPAKSDPKPSEPARRAKWGPRLAAPLAGLATIVLLAGIALVLAAEQVAEQTGLGQALVGASLLALATSLPEVGSSWAAARAGRATLAFAAILGSNLIQVTLLSLADLVDGGGAILEGADAFTQHLTVLAGVLVLLYAAGVLWRRQPRRFGLGLDSWLVLAAYFGGFAWIVVATH